jgi:hypothetical protein
MDFYEPGTGVRPRRVSRAFTGIDGRPVNQAEWWNLFQSTACALAILHETKALQVQLMSPHIYRVLGVQRVSDRRSEFLAATKIGNNLGCGLILRSLYRFDFKKGVPNPREGMQVVFTRPIPRFKKNLHVL